MVYHLSSELLRRGIRSPVHCCAMFALPGRSRVGEVEVRRHRYVFPWFGLSSGDQEALRLKGGSPLSLPLFFSVLFERRVSLIHVHVPHRLGGMARTAARLRRIPYVVSIHGGHFTLPQEQVDSMTRPFAGKPEWGKAFGALFGSRRVLQDADAVICVGQSEYDAMRRNNPEKLVFLIPNGVDVERFSSADPCLFRKAYGILDSERILLCVSRIDVQKNQMGLVRAFARFAPDHPDHRLVLIGLVSVEDYRDRLLDEIRNLNMEDRVRLIDGMVPDDPLLASAYKAAESFVLPSLHEPFGIVVLEAWAAGVPVLASRVGGIPGFAEDRANAWLVPPDDEDALAEGMTALADDPALRRSLSEMGTESVSMYGWPAITDRFCDVYQQVLNRLC